MAHSHDESTDSGTPNPHAGSLNDPAAEQSARTNKFTWGSSILGQSTVPGTPEAQAQEEIARQMLLGPFGAIDTARVYAGGRSEEVIGAARAKLLQSDSAFQENPQRARIFTKVDRDLETGTFDRDQVWRSFEQSCKALRMDRFDLVHLHDPHSITFAEAMAKGGAVQGMIELKEQGLAQTIGIATGKISELESYVGTEAFDAMLSHNRYTLVDRSAEPLMRSAKAQQMAVFNAAPFGGALLAKGSASAAHYAYRPSPPELLAWVAEVEQLCHQHGVSLKAVALHFSMRSEWIDSTVVGARTMEQFTEITQLAGQEIPDDLWLQLDELAPPPSPMVD